MIDVIETFHGKFGMVNVGFIAHLQSLSKEFNFITV